MKRLQIMVWVIFFGSLVFNCSFAQGNNRGMGHYLPLAKGNAWKYLKNSDFTNPPSGGNTIIGISIPETLIVGKYIYYKYNNIWLRYEGETDRIYYLGTANNEFLYIDFSIPDSISYNCYFGIVTARSKQVKIGDEYYTAKGYHKMTLGYKAVTHTECYFVRNFGMVYEDRYGAGPMANYFSVETKLIEFHCTDLNLANSYYTPAKPTIELKNLSITPNSYLNIKTFIDHVYSFLSYNNYSGVTFIKSASMEYFYFNGSDTLDFGSVNLGRVDEKNFHANLILNYPLFNSGYKFYYRIKAEDNSFVHHTVYLPINGFSTFENNQTTNPLHNYFPLNNSNKYVYKVEEININGNVINQLNNKYVYFINDTTIADKKYFRYYSNNNLIIERYDSVSSNIVTPIFNNCNIINELPTQFLWGRLEDSFSILVSGTLCQYKCGDVKIKKVFDADSTYYKTFTNPTTLENFTLAYNFGKIESIYLENNKKYRETLIAAKINNYLFGDSSLFVAIKEKNEDIPEIKFDLSQNYPNPFNPITTISFSIPNSGLVSLKIYDNLGKEITTLANEYLHKGVYTKIWNAGKYASGVYFYKLNAGKFNVTKKMLLIK